MITLTIVAGCSSQSETDEPLITPTPKLTLTPKVSPDDGTKFPEDVIPLSVSQFIFSRKYDWSVPVFDGEEYSAYSIFAPDPSIEFWSYVGDLHVRVYLFEDNESARALIVMLLGTVDFVAEVEVNDAQAYMTYREGLGEAMAIQQRGRLVIVSNAMPPLDATEFEQEPLQYAARNGLQNARL